MSFLSGIAGFFDSMMSWMSVSLHQTSASYCDLQTADSPTVLVNNDGSLLSIIRIDGVKSLIGRDEFDQIQLGMQQSLQTTMSQPGHAMQVYFSYNKDEVKAEITDIFAPAMATAERLSLRLDDLFAERIRHLSRYCAHEETYLVLSTGLKSLTGEQIKRANSVISDFHQYGLILSLLEAHDAVYAIRRSADSEFTAPGWRPVLPGDKITIKGLKNATGEISDILWPSLAKQVLPRDAENVDLRTTRIGDRDFSTVYIELFPKEIQTFVRLFSRTLQTQIPWRISFSIESDGLGYSQVRGAVASVLTVTSAQNRLISDSLKLLQYINLNTDDAVVRLRVAASTWAPQGDERLLRARASMLAKAIQGWGSCDTSEISGDAFEGAVSTMLAVSQNNIANPSIAPLSDVLYMLPLFRPASPWKNGAILFRSPDGKPFPYHPGNLAVCLSPGIMRLPRISIIDIGPSSSGLITLLKDALPLNQKHLVAHHRLRMRADYAINPFDTQLGCRYPAPPERSFLVNFITLLVTPVGSDKAYDGVSDMSGLVIDELYKGFADDGKPNVYAPGMSEVADGILEEIGFVKDAQTTWWEVTDALFMAGFPHEATLAQRYAMPVLADVAAVCRISAIQDLYGKIKTPTSEDLIQAFARMISSAVREYPIISQTTRFDLGEAKIVALDLDEVARSGGDAANRQTAVMYMLARYVMARHYFLIEDNVADMPEAYRSYHQVRIAEIREDPKRIVLDEFHRTSKAQAVREQVVQDMREGRKWKVQIALLSQSIEDFDEVMVEFATSVFIMEAGPEQAIQKTAKTFGLSNTARQALKARVHGPGEGGATFLAQFATKEGMNTQLLTSTLGPIELWALNTSAEDVNIRNTLYQKIGPRQARKLLAQQFPGGTATKMLEEMYAEFKEDAGFLDDTGKDSVLKQLIDNLLKQFYAAEQAPESPR
ncbi:MAG: type IV secretion protein IcmB [Gammaproteobacteria bacterium]|nr:type IV secretion protein IcmB [Gammaproteobacteria bacterium]